MRAYLNMTFSQKINQDFALSILLSLQARIQDFEMRGEIFVTMCNRNQSLVEVFEVCASA